MHLGLLSPRRFLEELMPLLELLPIIIIGFVMILVTAGLPAIEEVSPLLLLKAGEGEALAIAAA